MPFEFPNNPTNGEYANGFIWNAANQTWDSAYAPRAATVPISSPNYIINGGMDIWQRGTSWTPASPTAFFGPDRWQITRNDSVLNYSASRVSMSGTDAGLQYGLRMQRTSGTSQTAPMFVGHAWESSTVTSLQGKTVTLSCYLRGGANITNAVNVFLATGTGTDQGAFVGHTGEVVQVSVNNTLTTGISRFSSTFTVPLTATSMRLGFSYTPVGTAGAADYFDVSGVQLEEGAAPTTFRRNAPSIQGELAACQRYYIRYSPDQVYSVFASGNKVGAQTIDFIFPFPVTMRAVPGAGWNGTSLQAQGYQSYAVNGLSAPSNQQATKFGLLRTTYTVAVETTGYYLAGNNTTAAYAEWNAEL